MSFSAYVDPIPNRGVRSAKIEKDGLGPPLRKNNSVTFYVAATYGASREIDHDPSARFS